MRTGDEEEADTRVEQIGNLLTQVLSVSVEVPLIFTKTFAFSEDT